MPEYYSNLLQHLPSMITEEINNALNIEIYEEEVKSAIWALHLDKAPGLDGFSIIFYRAYWDLIKNDLVKMIQWTQRKKKIGGYTNSTFLALIPKENRPSSFSRFRPISLCNSSYKLITKFLPCASNLTFIASSWKTKEASYPKGKLLIPSSLFKKPFTPTYLAKKKDLY